MKNALTILKVTFIPMLFLFSFSSFGQCTIDAINAEITACEEELFDISINFEYENTSDQFTIAGNGNNYGTFLYSELPVTLTSLEANCETIYEFVVTDVENNDCTDFIVWGPVCCDAPCVLSELVLEASECDGGVFSLTMDFDYSGNTSSTFDWQITGVADGTAFFADLPLTVQIFNAVDNVLEFVAFESNDPNCTVSAELDNPCAEDQCEIGQLSVEIGDCIEDEFSVTIDFESANTSDQFTVSGNGVNYGTFAYANLPITIDGLEGNCSTEYEFVVTDINDDDCFNFYELGTVCCGDGCELFDLVIETSECDGGIFTVTFDFEYTGTTNAFFDWEIPGVDSGFAEFADLPLTITVENTSIEVLVLNISENDNPDCSIAGEFENPCYNPAECFIGALNVDVSECDGNFYFVVINFEYENTSDEFFVNINGENYGPFAYANLPVTIDGLESNCDVPVEILVYDSEQNGTCESETNIGIVCCDDGECEIVSIDFTTNPECVEGFIVTEWYIFAENTSEVGFDIFINDEFLLFVQYDGDGPYDFDIPDPETELFTISACDNDNPDCCYSWELENPCYEEPSCVIGEINTDITECENGLFDVIINFEYSGTSDQFTVAGNGVNYGTFSYNDLPITISQLEGDCSTEYEFVVTDVNDNDCSNFVELGTVCCGSNECDLFDLVIETSECDGGIFTVTFDFEYTGTTNAFFDWEIPGVDGGFAEFSDLPLTVSIENTSIEVLELYINENDNPDCNISGEFENPCFDADGECFIGELNVEVSECDGNLFFVVINFEYENTSDEFTVNGNGNSYGTFLYADLPITIDGIESDCDIQYEFVVHDIENNDCASAVGIGSVCCEGDECDLFDLVIETSECDGGFFAVTFDFEYTGTTNDFFNWGIPGVADGTAAFNDLPLTVTVESINEPVLALLINENDNEECSIAGEFENPCYESDECFIGELNVEVSECDGNLFFVVINFEYENTSDQFTVNGNGNSYGTFSYDDLPITIDGIESDCDLQYEFVVHDVENNDCASDVGIGSVCCEGDECDLFDLVIETSECDGNVFTVTFDFEYTGTTNEFFNWGIPGVADGTAAFADLPLTITLENVEENILELLINENDNEECSVAGEFENPCYESDECFIGELNVEVSECDSNSFFVVINFEYDNTSDQFTVNGNGNSYGTFNYEDLPITIDGLEADCDLNFEFVVHDVENDDCASAIGIGEVCCQEVPCDLSELDFELSECENGAFEVEVNFEYEGNTSELFVWEIPGIASGTNAFASLPISLTITNSTDPQFTFFANELENPDCSIAGTFGNPCYDEEECIIDDVTAEIIVCEDDLFDVEIDFEYENVGASFSIAGNGVEYGTFEYGDLPVVLTGLEADCMTEYEFVVTDIENEGCSDFVEIGTICCEDFNQISGIESETIVDGESFIITFKIDNTTLKDCNIDVFVGGELYTTLESDESTFDLGPFDCGQDNVLIVELVNTCTGEGLTFELDLSDIECITDVETSLDTIDLKWNSIQKILSIDGEIPVFANVQLLNTQGALIFAENGVRNGWSKSFETLPGGLYFVRITDNESSGSKGFIRKILIY